MDGDGMYNIGAFESVVIECACVLILVSRCGGRCNTISCACLYEMFQTVGSVVYNSLLLSCCCCRHLGIFFVNSVGSRATVLASSPNHSCSNFYRNF
jgi:hypothetical protein